jgi:hypothetical protein
MSYLLSLNFKRLNEVIIMEENSFKCQICGITYNHQSEIYIGFCSTECFNQYINQLYMNDEKIKQKYLLTLVL